MTGSTEPRDVAIPKYFRKSPEPPNLGSAKAQIVIGVLLAGLAVLGSLIGLADDSGVLCCTVPVLVAGGMLAFKGWSSQSSLQSKYDRAYELAEPKPSDAQMDEWLAHDLNKIVSGAMEKLGMVPEQVLNVDDPLVVRGPLSKARFALGKDDIIRFSAYEIVVIYLTNYHLGAYTCHLDFETGQIKSEQTQEYHYTDVVSVATLTDNSDFSVTTMDGKEHPLASHQQFTLSVASGERIKVAVAFPQISQILETGRLAPSGAEKAISTLRTMLREKKGGI